jgi:hypothetical protein
VALRTFHPTQRFSLEKGQLKESRSLESDGAKAMGNVVKLSEQKPLEKKLGTVSDEN